MKKFIVFAVVLALLVPAAAFAVTEFTLGGFIKLDTMWDSDGAVGKNLNGVPLRNNDANANHGRMKFTAQGSRFNMTIKGPQLWGAQVTGFFEMDFDASEMLRRLRALCLHRFQFLHASPAPCHVPVQLAHF